MLLYENETKNETLLPLLPLRGMLVFPSTVTTLDVAREKSIVAVEGVMQTGEKHLFVVAQRDASVERPGMEDLYSVGTVVTVRQLLRLPDNSIRALVEGEYRALLVGVVEDETMQQAQFIPLTVKPIASEIEGKAYMRALRKLALSIASKRGNVPAELRQALEGERDPNTLCDILAANVLTSLESKQAVLECADTGVRLMTLSRLLAEESQLDRLEEKINGRVREYMEKANHDYYLREQIHAIQDELGEDDDEDIRAYREKLRQSPIFGEARDRVEKELKRLARTSVNAPESSISENYIETMLELPWGEAKPPKVDIARARKVLEADHYGMRDVKDRLLEYLAVLASNEKLKSPIICLVGPPGVGKTSIARSVAKALNREFAQMSLGGMHDEAEIRGHRRTYVGAMPGRIISSIRQCKSACPVFLLDEIDKMSGDFRGDPASALLEVLDPEQNSRFRDHYIEAPYDLSKVLFITTANGTDTIDRALLDRMEIIEVPSYTLEDKVKIARGHLLPKQFQAHGMSKEKLKVGAPALRAIIDQYTRESGVRTLERMLAKLCRKAALELLEHPEEECVRVRTDDLKKYLGAPRFLRQSAEQEPCVGVVNGLAWTSVGGEVMPIEALTLPGKGGIEITGQLGDVMRESARIAVSVVRARMAQYGVPDDFFANHDLHIHVPEGAVPKDGPSAGAAMACAVLSAAAGIPARCDLAMTGEITLTGKVLPIGGVKEKLLAAYRQGIVKILLPRENSKDLEEIDEDIRGKMSIAFLDRVDDAIAAVLPEARQPAMRIAI